MTELLLGFLGGLIAWFTSSFLGEPLIALLSARRDVQKGLYFYANALADEEGRFSEAISYFRKMGAEVEGLKCSLLAPLFHFFGFRLDAAVTALTRFSNSLAEVGEPKVVARIEVQRALKLPIEQADLDILEQLRSRVSS